MLADIADAVCPVAIEEESKYSSNKVVMNLTLLHILVTLGTGMEAFLLATRADFTPRCFLVFLASRAFAVEEFPACTAI